MVSYGTAIPVTNCKIKIDNKINGEGLAIIVCRVYDKEGNLLPNERIREAWISPTHGITKKYIFNLGSNCIENWRLNNKYYDDWVIPYYNKPGSYRARYKVYRDFRPLGDTDTSLTNFLIYNSKITEVMLQFEYRPNLVIPSYKQFKHAFFIQLFEKISLDMPITKNFRTN
jgi:hypothetical protein